MNHSIHAIWLDLHQELKKFIFKKVKDADSSQDILQEVFLKIHSKIHTLRDYKKLTSWVYQLTRHAIADHFRRLQNYQVIDDSFDLPEQEKQEELYSRLSNCIHFKIEKLPEDYKQAVLLTTFQNYSQLELADYFGISYSGAKSRVQRAKDKLKIMILDCPNVETDKVKKLMDFQGNSQ
ncbi:RNA polymerase subunit sigma [Adhaeribacter arboris]|uniref:RNA polymerase subunit sigma n=1 Tax=Adhaeribacter arboris TaxID=2072846 RepID=A0A2T2YB56_9BACT|nr:sigma-70 family RNA polymerase sigma factor [Adhaeribacter arboris]PSR52760.1 RNA polymerase subunit sigma [Adhaeribacter arboris]